MQATRQSVSFTALDAVTGELLPERPALSVLSITLSGTPTAGGSPAHTPATDPGDYVVSDGHGGTVFYACQITQNNGTGGLIGLLGLGQPPSTSTTCVPATVITH